MPPGAASKASLMGNQSPEDRPGSSVVSFPEAKALAEAHGTPLLVCDLKRIEDNYKRLKALLRRFELYYAVKSNPHPKILKRLANLGSRFDVASKNEIMMCMQAGATPDRIIYANPVKPNDYIKFSNENHVRTFTFDNPNELEKMAKYAPGSDVILRIAVRDTGSTCKFSTKFGASEKDAIKLFQKAKSLGLKPAGISFHVGSQCLNMDNFSWALDICAAIFRTAEKRDMYMSILDVGGGIPIKYVEDVYTFEELAELINEKVEDLFPPWITPIAEPGRAICGDAMTLITKVIGVSKRNRVDCAYIDDGCYNSLSEKVFGHCRYSVLAENNRPKRDYTIFGPTCDSMDVVATDVPIPELKVDDILLVPSAGAYTNAAASHFNGFDPAKIHFMNE
jgi:ornithine decarboxylase